MNEVCVGYERISSLLFIISLIPLCYHDLKTRYIPDRYMLVSAGVVVLAKLGLLFLATRPTTQLFFPLLLDLLIAAALTALPFVVLYFLRDDIGGADAKLAAITGAWAGVEGGLRILLLGCLVSLLLFSLHHVWHRKTKGPSDRAVAYRYPLLPGICLVLSLATLRFSFFSF